MQRINLKKLKEALAKIPDDALENCYITHPYATETPDDDELQLIYYDDDWAKFFEKYDLKVLKQFVVAVFDDAKKIMEVIKNPSKSEDYQEDFPDGAEIENPEVAN